MCGFAGVFNFDGAPADSGLVDLMRAEIAHRGPDDRGSFLEGSIGIGFVRLSIIDLSLDAHQPMRSECGNYVLAYNGEIYNYRELRAQLKAIGYGFRSKSDTEVVLNAYREWGEECLERFNGMFAFALYDRPQRRLFLARDRFGIKPLYYVQSNNSLLFASEIRALLAVLPAAQIAVEPQAIFDYLAFERIDHTDATFFRSIKKLNHGHCMSMVPAAAPRLKCWYRLRDHIHGPFRDVDHYRATLRSAIELTLRSDVPVGVSLSGGLDSGTIVAMLLTSGGCPDLQTFSAVYGAGCRGDESAYIREFARHLRHMFYTVPTEQTLLSDLGTFVVAHTEPVPRTGPYAQFKVMQLAAAHVKVTLDGQGADETLAGYHTTFGCHYGALLKSGQLATLRRELIAYWRRHRSLEPALSALSQMLPRPLRMAILRSDRSYVRREFWREQAPRSEVFQLLLESADLRDALISMVDHKLEHLLKWGDRNSMHFGVESRVPFLDHRLVEGTLALPAEDIIRGGMTKFVLREAMRGILPEPIRQRADKVGFGTPEAEWFRSAAFQDFMQDLLHSRAFAENPYIDPQRVQRDYALHLSGRKDCARLIWKTLNLHLWQEAFLTGKRSWATKLQPQQRSNPLRGQVHARVVSQPTPQSCPWTSEPDAANREPDDATPAYVSIIVPAYRAVETMPRLLDRLLHQCYPRARYEIIVVSDGPDPDLRQLLGTHHPYAMLIERQRAGSYAARNAGARASRGSILAFTDADCEPSHHWLTLGVAALQDEAAGIVAGDVRMRIQRTDSAVEQYDARFGLRQDYYATRLQFGATANLFVRRRLFEALGGFDAAHRSAGDQAFCARARQQGVRLAFSRQAWVEHRARRTFRELYDKTVRVAKGRAVAFPHRRYYLLRPLSLMYSAYGEVAEPQRSLLFGLRMFWVHYCLELSRIAAYASSRLDVRLGRSRVTR
jgi:asparagine synthase (glutamine-hydrolysing)